MSGKQPLIVLLGPTAVGKTALSLRIAQRFHGEIISLDSMQVYRHLDVGTAKIRPEERQGIAHYCLDLVDPDEDYDAARYACDATAAIATIRQRGKIPLLVGGAGLYLRALEDGLFTAPPVAGEIRKKLNTQLDSEGIEKLHERLAACDPISAARIDHHDRSRIIRALEIYLATGLPWPEHLRRQADAPAARENHFIKIGLDCERGWLYQRINERCRNMLAAGLVEETQRVLAAGYAPDCKALGAIGYRHVIAWLRGECDYDKMLDVFMRDTRRYAKRQFTWFRHDPAITWFDWQADEAVCDFIAEKLEDVGADDLTSNP